MRQDAAFYVVDHNDNFVWAPDPESPLYVVCCGEMLIYATDDNGVQHKIRTTDDLRDFGITTDEELAAWDAKGEERFEWVHNPWFEVRSDDDVSFSEVHGKLTDAMDYLTEELDK